VRSEGSITGWIGGVRAGDAEAAKRIWERYSLRMSELASQRLPERLRCFVDGDDIANSVFCDLVLGLQEGRFAQLHDRDDLWALLACITVRKAINEVKRAMRQRRPPASIQQPVDEEVPDPGPAPDLVVMAAEQFEILLERLRQSGAALEGIALCKFEGYTNAEIAGRLGCSCRRVVRKLELIRRILAEEMPS
jgi:DNA-directed RNA polymerase specialized sigma24 family protein